MLYKVIAADGEQKAATALRDAADVMSSTPVALQLRYLQVHKKGLSITYPLFYNNFYPKSFSKVF